MVSVCLSLFSVYATFVATRFTSLCCQLPVGGGVTGILCLLSTLHVLGFVSATKVPSPTEERTSDYVMFPCCVGSSVRCQRYRH